ncbi:hypothetical protein AAFF_G00186070 [Aldrovandia affinis]|uniref:Uncharacterized protein n=1 Tax=Aldrovandia affinis TaxID=143900 RepID=A0AAD7SXU7_9TELE|nr:hypothetical protein AAFF_G00186070 [Aldrovandia affinis]
MARPITRRHLPPPLFTGAYSLAFLLRLVLNGFTLRVYFCQAWRHTGVSVYLQYLAAADFLLSLSLPLRMPPTPPRCTKPTAALAPPPSLSTCTPASCSRSVN